MTERSCPHQIRVLLVAVECHCQSQIMLIQPLTSAAYPDRLPNCCFRLSPVYRYGNRNRSHALHSIRSTCRISGPDTFIRLTVVDWHDLLIKQFKVNFWQHGDVESSVTTNRTCANFANVYQTNFYELSFKTYDRTVSMWTPYNSDTIIWFDNVQSTYLKFELV